MKKLLFILSVFVSLSAFSQVKIGPTGSIEPLGNYPAVKLGSYITGSYPVTRLTERDSIPSWTRTIGMSVYVHDNDSTYRLKGGILNTNWINATAGTIAAINSRVAYADTASMLSAYRTAINDNAGNISVNTASINGLSAGVVNVNPTDNPGVTSGVPAGVSIVAPLVAGTYTNFGGTVISSGDLTSGVVQIRKSAAGTWSKVITPVVLTNYYDKGTTTYTVTSKNLFDSSAVLRGYEVYTTGGLSPIANDAVSDYIPVTVGQIYTISGLPTATANRNWGILASDKTTVIQHGVIGTANGSTYVLPAVATSGAYLVFSLQGRNAAVTNFTAVQVESGSSATSFVAFSKSIKSVGGFPIYSSSSYTQAQADATFVKGPIVIDLDTSGKNLFDLTKVTNGYEVYSTGGLAVQSTDAVSDYIPVTVGTQYTISGLPTGATSSRYYVFLAADKTTVKQVVSGGTGTTIVTQAAPANTVYLVFSLKGRNISGTDFSAVQCEIGTSATSYQAAKNVITKVGASSLPIRASNADYATLNSPITQANQVINRKYIDDLGISTTLTTGKNLFDPTAIVIGSYVSLSDGGVGATAGYARTAYIPVLPSTTYTISGLTVSGSFALQYADINKTKLSFATFTAPANATFTTPASCVFITFTVYGTGGSLPPNLQVEQASSATAYEAYYSLNEAAGLSVSKLLNPKRYGAFPSASTDMIDKGFGDVAYLANKALNKLMLLFGDSITETLYGDGTTTRDNWPNYAAPILGATFHNYARSGATYKDRTGLTDPRQIIWQQITDAVTANESPDIIVIAIGTNDGTSSLGDYTTAMGKATLADLDRTLLFEAMRWAFWKCTTQWPNAKLYVCQPIQRGDIETETRQPLFDAIDKMAKRYCAIVINSTYESGIVKDFEFPTTAGRDLLDGLHPNASGRPKLGKYIARVITNTFRP